MKTILKSNHLYVFARKKLLQYATCKFLVIYCISFIAFKKDRTGDSSLMVLCLWLTLLQTRILNLLHSNVNQSYLLSVIMGLHIISLSPLMSPSFNGSHDMYSSLLLSQMFLANMFSNSSFSSLDVKKAASHLSNLVLSSFCLPERETL